MNSLSPRKAPDPSGAPSAKSQISDHTAEWADSKPARSFHDTENGAFTPEFVNDRPTVRPQESHEELVLCAVAAGAVSLGAASVAVKTGLLPADAQRAAESLFRERHGYQHFAAQMRGAR